VVPNAGPNVPAPSARRAIASAPTEQHPVEKALGPDLLKAPMQESRRHAEELRDEQVITELLNQWGAESYFRRRLLGRQAALHRFSHANVYFYTLRTLYETRDPIKTVEDPDHKALQMPLEKEEDRWSVELPAPKGFADDAGGTVRLGGSIRVIACESCKGIGRTVCPRCLGKQRIPAPAVSSTAPAAKDKAPTVSAAQPRSGSGPAAAVVAPASAGPALIPCPECSGAGGLPCERCEGAGRLVQKKTTTWRRRAATLTDHDDLPRIDEQWLQRVCKPVEVYREKHAGGFREEWRLVPGLNELIGQARPADQDTRVIMSEVVLEFIPVTEIVFDLGLPARPPAGPNSKAAPTSVDGDLYSWHIYGFEKRLPKDWRFLNWARVTAAVLVLLLVVAVAIIVLLLLG
jgi:eukaryotic-like serine/threonine-protein kinase